MNIQCFALYTTLSHQILHSNLKNPLSLGPGDTVNSTVTLVQGHMAN